MVLLRKEELFGTMSSLCSCNESSLFDNKPFRSGHGCHLHYKYLSISRSARRQILSVTLLFITFLVPTIQLKITKKSTTCLGKRIIPQTQATSRLARQGVGSVWRGQGRHMR